MLSRTNLEVAYTRGNGYPELTNVHEIARGQDLPFRLAELVSFYSCGNVKVAGILTRMIAQESMTARALKKYIKKIGCWGDGSSPDIATALGIYFDVG